MGGTARIIIVDDEADLRRLAVSLIGLELSQVPLSITEVAGGAEALICCARERVDVMVLDMNMPGVDGLAVLREVSAFDDRPQVVAWSADEHALQQATQSGADVAVRKGTDTLALVRAVEDCLGSAH